MTKAGKVELPLTSEADIELLSQQHENCTLPYINWTHRAHIAVALLFLKRMPLSEATKKISANIKAYNEAKGDGMGYHETITVVFMNKIYDELQTDKSLAALPDELNRLLKICTVEWLYHYYSESLIWSDKARKAWVDPDIKTLDF